MADILVVDDEESIATAFQRFLKDEAHDCRVAGSADEGLRLIAERQPNVLFMDVRMPGRDGVQALHDVRATYPDVYVVMMTAYGTSQTSIDTIRAGAFDYLTKPLDLDQLRSVLAKALAAQRVRDSSTATPEEMPATPGVRLVGESPAIQEVYKMIGRLATNDVPTLILGERGTGKRLVARTIHENSVRSSGPFTVLDCESTPEAEIEETLFAKKGGSAYLGAVEFLPAPLQARLAQALTSDRAGGDAAARARILAANERDLSEPLRAGTIKRELYDVLSIITLRIPPLRERRGDIPLLTRHFIQRLNEELNRTIRGMDDDVLRRFQEHPWPGNVGELERVVTRACIIARSDVITEDELLDSLTSSRFERRDVESALARAARTALHERLVERARNTSSTVFHDIVDLVEATLVNEALTITNGNQVKASEILGVNRATLRKKMQEE